MTDVCVGTPCWPVLQRAIISSQTFTNQCNYHLIIAKIHIHCTVLKCLMCCGICIDLLVVFCVCVTLYTYTYTYTCTCICIHLYTSVYIYMYMYMYTSTYVYQVAVQWFHYGLYLYLYL